MRDLLELRDEIDQIDSQIVDLYERRMAISEEVAEYKIAVGKKIFDKQRVGNIEQKRNYAIFKTWYP